MVSRMALLHHYFTDCIVGFLEGCLTALLVNYLALIIGLFGVTFIMLGIFYNLKVKNEQRI